MKGIYAGRFQPFHLGHKDAIKHILSVIDEDLYVIICSKKVAPMDDRNPWSYEERVKMIKKSTNTKRVHFMHVKDAYSNKAWIDVINENIPKGEIISFSNNIKTTTAFKEHNFKTESLPIKLSKINGTLIRKGILRGSVWSHLVPEGTKDVVEELMESNV